MCVSAVLGYSERAAIFVWFLLILFLCWSLSHLVVPDIGWLFLEFFELLVLVGVAQGHELRVGSHQVAYNSSLLVLFYLDL